jgi:hypothetical protein
MTERHAPGPVDTTTRSPAALLATLDARAGLNTDAGPLYGEMSAAAVMVMLPNIVMTVALQRGRQCRARKPRTASLKATTCSRFDRWAAFFRITSSEPAMRS